MIFDPAPYVAGLREANRVEAEAIQRRAQRARSEARLLAERFLARDSAVSEVILFGSLAGGDPSHLGFDIDLALVGGDTYRAMEIAEDSEFDVDVVRLDLLPEHLRTRIKEAGVVLARRR